MLIFVFLIYYSNASVFVIKENKNLMEKIKNSDSRNDVVSMKKRYLPSKWLKNKSSLKSRMLQQMNKNLKFGQVLALRQAWSESLNEKNLMHLRNNFINLIF